MVIGSQTPELIVMTVQDTAPDPSLVDDKAWQHLGITGQEFRRLWFAGVYDADPRPEVQALDRLMRTGQWLMI